MIKSKNLILIAILLSCIIQLRGLPASFIVDNSGSFRAGGLSFGIGVYNSKWQVSFQSAPTLISTPSYPVIAEKICEFQGEWKIQGDEKKFSLKQIIKEVDANSVDYFAEFSNKDGIKTRLIYLGVRLPVKDFDGKTLKVNDQPVEIAGEKVVMEDGSRTTVKSGPRVYKDIKSIVIPYQNKQIEISGNFTIQIIDGRKFNVQEFILRIYFTPHHNLIKIAKLTSRIRVTDNSMPVLLTSAGSGLLAEPERIKRLAVYGLKKGEYDKFKVDAVEFDLSTALEVGDGKTAIITLNAPLSSPYLYLLHNADNARAQVQLQCDFKDGSRQNIMLVNQKDFSVDKPPARIKNGAVATVNNRTYDALYYSVFPLEKSELWRLTVTCRGGKYLIAGAATGDGMLPTAIDSIYYVREDKVWRKFENWVRAEKGSVLDFSQFLDAPAGKYGLLKATRNGHFEAVEKPGKRFRFHGANLCSSAQYLEKDEAEQLVADFAACGYNSVRFHHYDLDLSLGNQDSKIFNPEQLDKLDYLFYCFKKHGIYITIDMFCNRRLKADDISQAGGAYGNSRNLKQLIRLTPQGRENWKKFTSNLLNHRNPYTGLTWAEDPALYAVALINEDFPFNAWQNKELAELELAGYRRYLQKNNLDSTNNMESRGRLFEIYIMESYREMVKDLTDFLREEIRYKGLISGLNHREFMIQHSIRDDFDYVDTHNYWDHPYTQFGWGLPRVHNQTNILAFNIWCPRRQFSARIFGKPFIMTELNYTFPNRYRAQYGPIIGAYAALQDWDGIYRFSWSHRRDGVRHQMPIWHFDIAQDALSQLSERIIALMFLREDIKRAPSAVAWPYGLESLSRINTYDKPSTIRNPIGFSQLGFFCRLGLLRNDREFPEVVKIKSPEKFRSELSDIQRRALENQVKISETGEIIYDAANLVFKVVAPKIESIMLNQGTAQGKILTVQNADSFQVITVAALDDLPLAGSRKILIFHQSDITNKYIRFASDKMQVVQDWGRNEQLIRRAQSTVKLALTGNDYKLQAIGLNGMPKKEIFMNYENNTITFAADTAACDGTMVYLLTK